MIEATEVIVNDELSYRVGVNCISIEINTASNMVEIDGGTIRYKMEDVLDVYVMGSYEIASKVTFTCECKKIALNDNLVMHYDGCRFKKKFMALLRAKKNGTATGEELDYIQSKGLRWYVIG